MSRCFPYPPPGYVRNGVCGNALIDSIKIQKEREKAEKKRRKERKNEKKEKKREKKEKTEKQKYKPSEFSDGKEKKLNVDNYNQGDKSWIKSREMHLGKKIEDEAEQLEKSDLTEEHEQPTSKNYSSDGTKSGSKRKKDALPSNGNRSHGSIIRIRLLQKHKEPDASLSKEQPCTVSGRADSCFEQKSERFHSQSQEQSCSTSSGTNVRLMEATPKLDTELLCSSSGRINSFSLDGLGTASASPLFEDEIQREELSYKALIENWVPPSQHYEQDAYDDQGWLFETKLEDQHVAKRPKKASSEVSCHWTPSLWPRAHYLPEADIYALPYTVLF